MRGLLSLKAALKAGKGSMIISSCQTKILDQVQFSGCNNRHSHYTVSLEGDR